MFALDLDQVGEVGRVLDRRVDDVQPAEDGEHDEQVELAVGYPAHERGVAVDVVRGHDRKQRSKRRVGPEVLRRQELVDPHVRGPVEPDLAVGIRQVGSPANEVGAVASLHGVEEPERAVRVAGAAHLGDHVDVAALDEVGERARLGPGLGATVLAAERADGVLAVRRLDHDHREPAARRLPAGGIGGIEDVRPQDRAVTHRHGDVAALADSVARLLGLPRARSRGGDQREDDGRDGEPGGNGASAPGGHAPGVNRRRDATRRTSYSSTRSRTPRAHPRGACPHRRRRRWAPGR